MTWPTKPLGELTINHDGKRRPVKEAERRPGPYPYYGASGVVDYVDDYLIDGDYLLVAEDGENLRTRQTPIAFMARGKSWVNNHAHIVTGNERADTRFLMYAIQATDIGGYLTGAVMPKLTQANLNRIQLPCPDMDVQRQVAEALGALDDKIELNRRMSQTLEDIAHAIFKSWFVDFDPVLALSAGQDPAQVAGRLGLSPEAIQLFTSELADVEGQLTPVGWKLSTLGEEVKAHGGLLQTGPFGSQLHASDYTDDGIPVVMPQDLVNRRIATGRVARIPQDTADGLKRHMLKAGDVVYSRRGDVERHALVSPREIGWLCGTGCLLVRMGSGWPSPAYLSETLNDKTTREWIVRHAVGATMPNLNTAILASVPLLVPPAPLLQHFESVVGTLREQQEALSTEAESLAALRDELLPRLLSGELVVA